MKTLKLKRCKFDKYLIIFVALLVMLALAACQSVTRTDPNAINLLVIEDLEAAHNAQDVESIIALYAEDGFTINNTGIWQGPKQLRTMYDQAVQDFQVDHRNYQVEDNKVFYDCYMIIGHQVEIDRYEAIVENGKITSNVVVEYSPAD